MAEKRGSELVFQDVRARRSRVGLSLLPACHRASSGRGCPQSSWWPLLTAGTLEQQRHAGEAQAPGCPQRAHGEYGLQARPVGRGWAHPGWSPGGMPGRAGQEPACCQRVGEVGYRQEQAVGSGALTVGPSRWPCWGPGATLGMRAEYGGHRLLVLTASFPAALAPSGLGDLGWLLIPAHPHRDLGPHISFSLSLPLLIPCPDAQSQVRGNLQWVTVLQLDLLQRLPAGNSSLWAAWDGSVGSVQPGAPCLFYS